MHTALSSAMDPQTRILLIFLSSFVIISPALSRVVDRSELPLNGWPIEDINLQQNDNSESLEDELESLHPPLANPSSAAMFSSDEEEENSVESFDDELDDIGQQRERPLEGLEEAEKNAKEITVTTLVPSVLTEENTRVDEPTERGPAEPTKENGATATSVMSEVQTFSSSPVSSVNVKKLSQKEKIPEWKEQSEEEQLLEMKELRWHGDAENDSGDIEDEDGGDDDNEDDDDFFSEEDEDEDTNSGFSSNKMKKGSPKDNASDSQTKIQLRKALQENGLFSRSARHMKGLVNPGYEEEMLEFLVRLSKNPKGWARVSEILGKMDYDTSSRLKTALQMKALQENRKPYQLALKDDQRKILNAHSFLNTVPISENDVVKPHVVQEQNKSKSNKNTQIKPYKTHANKLEKDLPPTANPVHIGIDMKWHKGKPKLFFPKAHSKMNSFEKALPFSRQMNDPFDSQLQESELQRLSESHGGPLNAIAIDIPDSNMFANRFPHDDNKHAYVAVSVYKPTKENYQRIDIDPKINSYPARYSTPLPISKMNRKFAVEKPVTIVDSPLVKGSEGSRHNDFSQRVPNATKTRKGKNKYPKQVKNEDAVQRHKPKLPQRLGKHKSKLATDEIEAQLIALTKMEQKLRQHLLEKEKLRQRIRTGHRLPRSSYM